jgi:hypothetical protein
MKMRVARRFGILTATAAVALSSTGVAMARHGADDPVPHARHGADDTPAQKARHHHRHDRHGRHGADDPAGHR